MVQGPQVDHSHDLLGILPLSVGEEALIDHHVAHTDSLGVGAGIQLHLTILRLLIPQQERDILLGLSADWTNRNCYNGKRKVVVCIVAVVLTKWQTVLRESLPIDPQHLVALHTLTVRR